MADAFWFKIDEKIEYTNLPENVLNHCEKQESKAAASKLIKLGAKNLRYEENGKPVCDNCYVSISHSGNFVAVCKSALPVGIDIECLSKDINWQRLAERYFSLDEIEFLNLNPCKEVFLEIWTKKEALSKISGNGLSDIFKKVSVFSTTEYTFKTTITEDFVLSVCEKEGA
jgi:phosphopantetheinyl transferase